MNNELFGKRRVMRGFTLIEMLITMIILGITSVAVGIFIVPTVTGYVDTVRRSEMVDAADTTLRRIARDVHAALPNSIRGAIPASNQCFQFIPITGGGRYRVAEGAGTDILDFVTPAGDSSFDYLSGTVPSTGNIVIWNMGSRGPVISANVYAADAYHGDNRAAISTATPPTTTKVTLAAAKLFPYESEGGHFFVIPPTTNGSVVYSCNGGSSGSLLRSTPNIAETPMTACPTTGTVIADHVDCTKSSFIFSTDSASNYGLLAMTLVLRDPATNEEVTLYHEVRVNNVP